MDGNARRQDPISYDKNDSVWVLTDERNMRGILRSSEYVRKHRQEIADSLGKKHIATTFYLRSGDPHSERIKQFAEKSPDRVIRAESLARLAHYGAGQESTRHYTSLKKEYGDLSNAQNWTERLLLSQRKE